MEDIYQFLLSQRHIIENKYYDLKSQSSIFNDLDINNITEYYDSINNSIEVNKKKLLEYEENKTKKTIKVIDNNSLYLSDNMIKKLLKSYDDGIYGLINYYPNYNSDKLLKYIKKNEMTYHNKESIVNKIIKNNKFTDEAKSESYGVLFMYEKRRSEELDDLNKVYLLKNGNIEDINKTDDEEDDESLEDNDKIVTKIYHFDKKITLKEIIYESNYLEKSDESDDSDNSEDINDFNESNKEQKMLIEKKEYIEGLYKITKKYKKYIEDNVKSDELKETLNNFSFIKNLIRKISDPSKKLLSIQDVMKFNYMSKLDQIKISNRLDKSEYDILIEKYFEEDLIKLTNDMVESYDIGNDFKSYLYVLFEIMIRIYIDNHLGNSTYCLSKNLTEYFNFSALFSEPTTLTISLKRRYWNQLLETKDTKKILSSLLMLINNKTQTLDMTLKYLESLYQNNSKINSQINDY